MIKAVLFDLDGTLLPMDQNTFVKAYFEYLINTTAPYGYDADQLMKNFVAGMNAMTKNDGTVTNQQMFWNTFAGLYGERVLKDKPLFETSYGSEFDVVKKACGFNPEIKPFFDNLKTKGCKIVLATNPMFPKLATQARIKWTGLSHDDFEFFTTYEDYSHCKPNLDYYRHILQKLNLDAEECVMVGNDVVEDMAAQKLGMKVFLLTDCLINKNNEDITKYPHGNITDLKKFLDNII